ncbi:MAG: NTP transferase domain-containing protein [candidate division Zixibacteria bacterium]|nr:NTP transferase domain-containing protein [candidate division Zixibacteria bacterium]
MTDSTAAIILAAGKGKRMKSDLPKVLHRINGVSMIRQVLTTLDRIGFDRTVVVIGHKGEQVIADVHDFDVEFVWQREQLGTGHAVMMAEDLFTSFDGTILVAAGDVPFLSTESITRLLEVHRRNQAGATCLSANFDDPTGYGRIVRKEGTDILLEIVEHKDADEATRRITEINSGTFCFSARELFAALHKVKNNNVQQEYYLTDTIKIMQAAGTTCAVWQVPNPMEVSGVNSVDQLKALEKAMAGRDLTEK